MMKPDIIQSRVDEVMEELGKIKLRRQKTEILRIHFDEPVAVIGDIHGRFDLLNQLFGPISRRKIVVVGDVIDKGPQSREVIDWLISRQAVGVRGNHEEWLLDWLRGKGLDDWALKPMMGGLATLQSYGLTGTRLSELKSQVWRIPDTHKQFLESLALVGDLEVMGQKYWLVHAGVRTSLKGDITHLAQNHARELLWDSNKPEEMLVLDRPTITGHRPRLEPLDMSSVIAIDTGAGMGGRLTALLLPERTFITVRN